VLEGIGPAQEFLGGLRTRKEVTSGVARATSLDASWQPLSGESSRSECYLMSNSFKNSRVVSMCSFASTAATRKQISSACSTCACELPASAWGPS
jgi:hypothetical protein